MLLPYQSQQSKKRGALGMLVINNVPGDAIIMGGLTDTLFPSVMISQTQGADLYEDYDDALEITLGAFQKHSYKSRHYLRLQLSRAQFRRFYTETRRHSAR